VPLAPQTRAILSRCPLTGPPAIVGGYGDNDGLGAAWVFTCLGGVWSQQGSKLVGAGAADAAQQGYSVALSADGSTALVGAPNDNNGLGAAWAFTRSGGVWRQQGSKLVGTGAAGGANQGYSIALSADGNTAVVGGYCDNNGLGAAWAFTRSSGVWSQQGSRLVGAGAAGAAQQGHSVSLSADGNTVIVGGPRDNHWQGAAWVFTRSGDLWSQQGSKLVGTGGAGGENQGYSVALSGDGHIALVGGPADNRGQGAAWAFMRSAAGAWWQQGPKLGAAGDVAEGSSVALSDDGKTAIVGEVGYNSSLGAARVFTRGVDVWSQGPRLVGADAEGLALEGSSVALSADGNTAVVGGLRDNNLQGAAWVFTRSGVVCPSLFQAVEFGDLLTVQTLLANGTDVESRDKDGVTALMAASALGHRNIVDLLISKGAEVNATTTRGMTPLMFASLRPDLGGFGDTTKALLAGGAKVDAKNAEGRTALMIAASTGNGDSLQALLAAGADVNAKQPDGTTALMDASESVNACESGRRGMVTALLASGADPNAKRNDGATALSLTTDAEAKALLLKAGAIP
jgi:hypothetical protein